MSSFTQVRDGAVAIGRAATALTVEQIDDPTLSMAAGGSLDEQLRYLRAFRSFRAAIEELRP